MRDLVKRYSSIPRGLLAERRRLGLAIEQAVQQQQGGQTNYNLTPTPAQPGVLSDTSKAFTRIMTVVAGVVIPAGVLCETYVSSGKVLLRPVQDSTTGGSFAPTLAGISFLDPMSSEQTYVPFPVPPSGTGSSFAGYPIGFPVPVVRVGRIWASWDGNTGTALPSNGAMKVWHSSDGTHSQGIFTTLAVSAVAGAEIDLAGAYINLFDPNLVSGSYTDSFGNTVQMVNLEINLPGHS